MQNENDERVERKRLLRVLQNEQFELDMEEAIQKVSFRGRCSVFFIWKIWKKTASPGVEEIEKLGAD